MRESSKILIMKPPRRRDHSILDESFRYIMRIGDYFSSNVPKILFFGLNGFDIDTVFKVNFAQILFETEFNLYKKGRIIQGCDNFHANSTFMFSSSSANKTSISRCTIFKPKSKHPICSEFFRNALVKKIDIYKMIKSFYFERIISFTDSNKQISLN